MEKKEFKIFKGHNFLRQRLSLSLLSQTPIKILEIRSNNDSPGLREHEASLLRLIEKITTGSTISINHTGTVVTFVPGYIYGGTCSHVCNGKSIGYFAEFLISIAWFGKFPLKCELTGITNDNINLSCDLLRTSLLPQMSKFGIECALKIVKRGAYPDGGGLVVLEVGVVKSLKPVLLTSVDKVKRIRGIAYCTKVSPQIANRMVDSSRKLLTRYIPDVYIYTDSAKGKDSGNSPGYGLSLVAETENGIFYSKEYFHESDGDTPEGCAQIATLGLLKEIEKGGVVDGQSMWLYLLLIAHGPYDVSKICVGSVSPFTVQYMRDLKEICGIVFKVVVDGESVVLSTLGLGCVNLNKNVT